MSDENSQDDITPEDYTPEQISQDDQTAQPDQSSPHENSPVTNLDSKESLGRWDKAKRWIVANKATSAIVVIAVAAALGGGGYFAYDNLKGPDQSVAPKRPWADNIGQRSLPEAKVIPGAQAGSLSTIDNQQGGKVVTAPVVGIDGEGPESGATLSPPEDISQVGYYVRSAGFGPGNAGTTVLTSHIDYAGKVGFGSIFTSLKKDDPITLTSSDGKEFHYVVEEDPGRVSKQDPEYVKKTMDTINRSTGPAELIMVTCGGEFLGPDSPLGYADNTIVRASLVDSANVKVKDASK